MTGTRYSCWSHLYRGADPYNIPTVWRSRSDSQNLFLSYPDLDQHHKSIAHFFTSVNIYKVPWWMIFICTMLSRYYGFPCNFFPPMNMQAPAPDKKLNSFEMPHCPVTFELFQRLKIEQIIL